MTARTAQMCAAYKSGEPVKEIANRFGVQNPAVWKALRRGGVLPPYQPKREGKGGRPVGGGNAGYSALRLQKSVAAISAREGRQPVPSIFVDRDPCGFCGVRGDIGCRHKVSV